MLAPADIQAHGLTEYDAGLVEDLGRALFADDTLTDDRRVQIFDAVFGWASVAASLRGAA